MARFLLPAFFALVVAPQVAHAKGWEEVHLVDDDVRFAVRTDGVAVVQHHLRYRVVAGHIKAFDYAGIEPNADLVAEASILAEQGGSLAARVEANPKADGAVKVTFDEPRGLGRGVYVVEVQYRLDLVAAKMFARDGAMWTLSWTAPPSVEGHDAQHVVFELPPAPTEPRLANPEQAVTTQAVVRRDGHHDELELVRAHVPRGEAALWAARVDPKAFPDVVSAELKPAPSTRVEGRAERRWPVEALCAGTVMAGIAVFFALLLREKQRRVRRACERLSLRSRGLIPWGATYLPPAYGVLATCAFGTFLWGSPVWGALLVVGAMMLATHRSPVGAVHARGPGSFAPIADADVFAKDVTVVPDGLDVGTARGAFFAFALAVSLCGLGYVLQPRIACAGLAIVLTGTALVPIFVTGTRAQLPQSAVALSTAILLPARDKIARLVDLAHVDLRCLARFLTGSTAFDEVRLACSPNTAIPGLRAIEVAVSTGPWDAHAERALPEVLVRFDEASNASAKVARLASGMRIFPGRAAGEKVLRLSPRQPTPAGTARLVARLLREFENKRGSDVHASASTGRAPRLDRRSRKPGPAYGGVSAS